MNVIYKTSPTHTEDKVVLDKVIEIYFMIDMNKNTFKSETIILFNLTEQIVEPVSFEYVRRMLKIRPIGKLKPNNHYQLQLLGGEKGLRDITNRMMAQTYEVEFYTKSTEAIKPPKILSPTDLSMVREAAIVQLESLSDVDYYELQISKSNTFHNLVWPLNGEKVYRTPEVHVIPNIAYETGTYYLRVRSVDFEGKASWWSPVIRYHYDGAPIIITPPEEPIPTEPTPTEPTPAPTEGEIVTQSARKVVLKAMSRLKSNPDQLSKLQNIFSTKEVTTPTDLYVKSSSPKDKSVNNNVSKFNDIRENMNKRQIVIELTDVIDKGTVNSLTCYVLSERN